MEIFENIFYKFKSIYLESERPTTIEIFFSTILSLLTFLILFSDVFQFFSVNISLQYKIILVFFVFLSIALVTLHIRFRRLLRYQILERNEFIEKTVENDIPSYQISELCDTYEIINRYGDSEFSREVELSYINNNINWFGLSMGSTNNIPLGHDTKLIVTNLDTNKILVNLPYQQTNGYEQHAIILNPPVSKEHKRIRFNIQRKKWPLIWKDLLHDNYDIGNLTVINEIKRLEMTIIIPKYYLIEEFNIEPKIGSWKRTRTKGKCALKFTAIDVQPPKNETNKYQYNIRIKKVTRSEWRSKKS